MEPICLERHYPRCPLRATSVSKGIPLRLRKVTWLPATVAIRARRCKGISSRESLSCLAFKKGQHRFPAPHSCSEDVLHHLLIFGNMEQIVSERANMETDDERNEYTCEDECLWAADDCIGGREISEESCRANFLHCVELLEKISSACWHARQELMGDSPSLSIF